MLLKSATVRDISVSLSEKNAVFVSKLRGTEASTCRGHAFVRRRWTALWAKQRRDFEGMGTMARWSGPGKT